MQRWTIAFAALLTSLAGTASPAWAADYPTKPIQAIGPFGAGGADLVVRKLAELTPKYLGQPLVYLNKPGAAGTIAGETIARAAPDGYTIGALVSTGAVPEIYRYFQEARYTSADLRPIIRIGSFPYALFVKADSRWATLGDFVAEARAKPDDLSYVHAGVGHAYHLLLTSVMKKAGASIKDAPVAGGGPAIVMLLGGHVDGAMAAVSSGKEHLIAGKLRMLAVQHDQRFSWAPQVPTFAEAGYDFGFAPWYLSVFAPAKTPDSVVSRLQSAMKQAVSEPSYRTLMENAGIVLDFGSEEDVRRDIQTDIRVIGGILRNLGMYK